jgi:hypothetical protein
MDSGGPMSNAGLANLNVTSTAQSFYGCTMAMSPL